MASDKPPKRLYLIKSSLGWLDGMKMSGAYEWTNCKSTAWPFTKEEAERRLEKVKQQVSDAEVVPT